MGKHPGVNPRTGQDNFRNGIKHNAPAVSKEAWEEIWPEYTRLRLTLTRDQAVTELNQMSFERLPHPTLT